MDIGILPEFRNPTQWATPIEQIYREGIEKAVLAEVGRSLPGMRNSAAQAHISIISG